MSECTSSSVLLMRATGIAVEASDCPSDLEAEGGQRSEVTQRITSSSAKWKEQLLRRGNYE